MCLSFIYQYPAALKVWTASTLNKGMAILTGQTQNVEYTQFITRSCVAISLVMNTDCALVDFPFIFFPFVIVTLSVNCNLIFCLYICCQCTLFGSSIFLSPLNAILRCTRPGKRLRCIQRCTRLNMRKAVLCDLAVGICDKWNNPS